MNKIERIEEDVEEWQMEQLNSTENVKKHISVISSLKENYETQADYITRLQTRVTMINRNLKNKINECISDISELKSHTHQVNNMSIEVAVEDCNDNIEILNSNIIKLRDVVDNARNTIMHLQNDIDELKTENYNSQKFIPSSVKHDTNEPPHFDFPILSQEEIDKVLQSDDEPFGQVKKEYLGINPFTGETFQANVISIIEPSDETSN